MVLNFFYNDVYLDKVHLTGSNKTCQTYDMVSAQYRYVVVTYYRYNVLMFMVNRHNAYDLLKRIDTIDNTNGVLLIQLIHAVKPEEH